MYVTLSQPDATANHPIMISTTPCARVPAQSVRPTRAGQTLFLEGDDTRYVYEVQTGVLRLTRVLENGARQVIAFALPGDIVGFPRGDYHHTDCDVLVAGKVIAHRRGVLDSCMSNPQLHRRLMQAALSEISGMQDHFMMLARKSAQEKLASFLMVMTERAGTFDGSHDRVYLPMKRSDIADFLGLTIETVCRAFTKLRKAQVIALEDANTVIVLDPDALAEAALVE